MEDYNRVLEATSVAENANGVAAEKMTVYNESLEAAQNRLTASVQQFAQDSNLDRILALAYDGLSKVVEILNILLNKIPVLSPLIKAMGVALATAFAANMLNNLAKTSTGIGTIISTIGGAIPNLQAFVSLVGTEFVTAMTAAGGGLSGLISGFGAAATAAGTLINPVTAIIAVLGAIVAIAPAVYSAWQEIFPSAEERLNKSTQELNEANSKLEETKNQIQEIQDKIDTINSKDSLTIADEAEKDRLQEQLDTLEQIKKVQEDIAKTKKGQTLTDTQGLVTSEYSGGKSSDEYFADLKKKSTSTRARYAGKLTITYDTESASVQQLIANLKYLDEQKKNLNETDSTYQEDLDKINQLESENNSQLLTQKQTLLGYKQSLIEAGDTSSEAYQLITNLIDQINIALDPSSFGKIKISELIDDSGYDGVLSNLHDKAVSAVQKAGEDSSKEAQDRAKQAMNQLNGYITTEANKLAEQIMGDDTLKQQFAEWLNISPKDLNLDKLTEVLEQQLQEAYGVAAEAANTASNANTIYGTTLSDNATLADELAQKEVDLGNKTKSLSDAYNAMNKNGKITKAQMTALIKDYPELASAIEVSNGAIKVNTQALKDQYDQIITTHNESIQAQIDDTKIVIEQTKQRILAYQAEIAALQTVQLTKSTFVDEAYDPETGTMTAGRSQSVEGTGGNRFGSATNIQKQIDAANKSLDDLYARLNLLSGAMHTDDLSYTDPSSSSTSQKDKEEKEFEDSVKTKIKNLKAIVTLYSKQDNWSDPEVVKNFTNDYNNLLNEVVNDPKARKILADSFNLDISKMSNEEAIENLTTLWKDQAGTIDETYQKLLESRAKEDLNSAKEVINAYKEGVYGAWSSDEALNAAKADYQKFIDEITNNADYRAAMAKALNLGDISGKSVEDQVKAVIAALQKSTGTVGEAYDELAEKAAKALKEESEAREKEYEEAVKNIQELQKLTVNMIETAIDLLEKAGDIVFNLLSKVSKKHDKQINALDEQMDNLDKIADNLDEQKDAFDDKIDAQKEMLKLQKEEMDNADELADKNRSIADIDAQLMELQYDNSAEAQAKRLKLLDERAQKEKDLSDYQKDQAYDTKVDALDREKDAYDKNIEAQKKYIEEQKNALKEQQDAIKAAQEKFETNLDKARSAFEGLIKILNSTVFKNLAANVLDSLDGQTLKNILTAWNNWFGDGLESTVSDAWDKAYDALTKGGWAKGDWINDILNIFQKGQQTEGGIQDILTEALNSDKIDFSAVKNAISSASKSFSDFTKEALKNVGKIDDNTANVIQNVLNLGQKAINTVATNGNGITQMIAKGIQTVTENGIGSLLKLGSTGEGVIGNLGQSIFSILQNIPGLAGKAVSAIGKVLGIGGVSTAGSTAGVGTAATGAGVAAGGSTLATAGLAGVAAAGVGLGIYNAVETVKDISKEWQDSSKSTGEKLASTLWKGMNIMNPLFGAVKLGKKLFGKHHSGADYVKKQNPMLDKMLGFGNDETVSVLKVGEAVVPTWANSANRSSNNSSYTGAPISNAVASAVKSARATMGNSNISNTTNSPISISIPINIQGDADMATVKALKGATNDIVNTVLKTINNQTRLGGYRNIKAATV